MASHTCRDGGHASAFGAWRALRQDAARWEQESTGGGRSARGFVSLLSALLTPPVMALALHRASHMLHVRGWVRIAGALAGLNHLVHKVSISPASCLGGGVFLPHPVGVVLHARAGRGLTLYSHVVCRQAPGAREDGAPDLGDDVTLGVQTAVVGPVRLGDGSRVGFHACIAADVPPGGAVFSRASHHTGRASGGPRP